MNLLKTKMSIYFVKDTIIITSVISLILLVFSSFFIFVGKSTGDKVLSSIDDLIGMIRMFWIVCLSVCIAHLCNKHIVYDFITKKINLIYTYPYKKKDHLNSNVQLIIIEMFVIGIVSFVIYSTFTFILYHLMYQKLNYDIFSYVLFNLITLVTILVSISTFIYIAYKFKTSSILFIVSLGYAVFQTLSISGFDINYTFEITKLLFTALVSVMLYFNIQRHL